MFRQHGLVTGGSVEEDKFPSLQVVAGEEELMVFRLEPGIGRVAVEFENIFSGGEFGEACGVGNVSVLFSEIGQNDGEFSIGRHGASAVALAEQHVLHGVGALAGGVHHDIFEIVAPKADKEGVFGFGECQGLDDNLSATGLEGEFVATELRAINIDAMVRQLLHRECGFDEARSLHVEPQGAEDARCIFRTVEGFATVHDLRGGGLCDTGGFEGFVFLQSLFQVKSLFFQIDRICLIGADERGRGNEVCLLHHEGVGGSRQGKDAEKCYVHDGE